MKLRFEDHGPLCVVQVEGELVGESSDSLRRACRERLEGGSRDFILDVSTTSGIDKTVLDITRVSDRLEIHDEVASATRVLR
ncbi:MAG: STAS domain-containing protein [Planctomycetota bacterium]|jgi:anti-anti-sigma regulatory factor